MNPAADSGDRICGRIHTYETQKIDANTFFIPLEPLSRESVEEILSPSEFLPQIPAISGIVGLCFLCDVAASLLPYGQPVGLRPALFKLAVDESIP